MPAQTDLMVPAGIHLLDRLGDAGAQGYLSQQVQVGFESLVL